MKKKNTAVSLVSKKKFRTTPIYVFCLVVLVIYVIGLMLPLLWGVGISFIPSANYFKYKQEPLKFPSSLTLSNYLHGLTNFKIMPAGSTEYVYLDTILLNTILYAGGCALAATLTPFVVAYLSARFKYKFSGFIYGLVLIVMSVPIIGNMPSEILVAKSLGIFDTIWGMWILKLNFLGIYFLVFHAIFSQIPMDFTESAKIDGANNWKIMTRVIFPFASGTFGIVYLINFITFWNDYQVPNYYLPSHPVVGTAIFLFSTKLNEVRYTDAATGKLLFGYNPQLFAMIFIVAIPVIVLAIVFNKKLMGNLSDGGVKE